MSFVKDPESHVVLNNDIVGYHSFQQTRVMSKKIEELENALKEMKTYFKEIKEASTK
jgi:hypothetical protein